jgi:hypothetical protein
MHKRVYRFSDAAIQYVQDCRPRLLGQSSDSESESSSENSFSSGIYIITSSQSSELYTTQTLPVSKKTSHLPALSEEEEFGSSAHQDKIDAVPDTDSEAE